MDRTTKLFVPTDKRLTGAGPWPAPPAPVPAPGAVAGVELAPVVEALFPLPLLPHPAATAASSTAADHIGSFKMFSNLFMYFS